MELNREQIEALKAVQVFLRDDALNAFILRGSAGTGKTTLIAKLVGALAEMNLSCQLLAPTGRAARIMGNKVRAIVGETGYESRTIHSAIYSLKQVEVNEEAESANDPGLRMIFPLRSDEPGVSLFVVDESSMVGDKEAKGDLVRFGSGRLLMDLVTFSRARRPGRGGDQLAKLLFVGDAVQLPPVGETFSPALSEQYLKEEFGLRVAAFELKTVMRQAQGSAILDRATALRDAVTAESYNEFSLQSDQQDIRQADMAGALELILHGIKSKESTVAVVHSNAAALDYNRSIRQRRWGDAELVVQTGDTLLVNKNSPATRLSNGDLIRVMRVGNAERVAVSIRGGFRPELRFRDVAVAFRAADGQVVQRDCWILENLLDSPHRELGPVEVRALLVHFRQRHPNLHPKSDEFRATIRDDPYFGALQVKYGYAMTCHKAQGGEWDTAIVDFSAMMGTRNATFFRWAYTAITRARKTLVVVNPPNFSATSAIVWAAAGQTSSAPAQPGLEEIKVDPDWDRFSFSAGIAPLMVIHQQLRSVWRAQGIEVDQLQHLQYQERYTLSRDGKRAIVQYYYDGKYRVGKAGPVPNASSDRELAEDALTSMQSLGRGGSPGQLEPFISEFLVKLDAALVGSAIRRNACESLPYRLRVGVTDGLRRGKIDFSYNGKSTWTMAQEVGGPGSSQGLYEEVQNLMAETGESE
ncbi:hypothetical protein B1991_01815 [Rhodanobacter lindaniclasticus]|uniref:Uncharacterized protein n=1 Tax=Rhodanobacter lindaniclasticus TaxID=75310 RepID=A0A4S3KLD7_9GAMM|nr:hypothetical protein B1991_01815 [Rhodanobacter lindaniclasticus]